MKNGPYILVKAPEDFPGKKYRGVYAYEHTVIWWLHTKIIPPAGYQIHHINEVKTDNRFENLELVYKSTHMKLHRAANRRPMTLLSCAYCNQPFQLETKNYKSSKKKGQQFFHCSRSCQVKNQRHVIKLKCVRKAA